MSHGFEIWRQRKGAKPERLKHVPCKLTLHEALLSFEETEHREGGEIGTNGAGGFTVSSRYVVISSDDGSGLPRSREVMVPSAHYWHEEVMTDECPIMQDVLDQLACVMMRLPLR